MFIIVGGMVGVLGAVRFASDNRDLIPLASASQRRLLAALAVADGRLVRSEYLSEVLGLGPGALRTTMFRLRARIGSDAIVTDGAGYRLCASTDAGRFEQLLDGDSGGQKRLLDLEEALGLWTGDAIDEFCHESWAQGEAERLNELRRVAQEDRAELLVALGRSGEAVASLKAQIAENPRRDRARGLMIQALTCDGRQSDALREYQEYWSFLADETGLDPSLGVQAIADRVASGVGDERGRIIERLSSCGRWEHSGLVVTSSHRSSIPASVERLIGRDSDVGQISASLGSNRLVSLTGPGGVGKTRLALEVARDIGDDYPDGMWLIELAELRDPASLSSAVVTELGVAPRPGMSSTQNIAQSLGDRQGLLVLDNCEHVLDAVAELVQAILGAGTKIAVLATSREALRVAGEFVWQVPALDLENGRDSAAFELFCERARAADKGFSVSNDEVAADIVDICARLDGMPLAIELAAARMVSMSPGEVRERLISNFTLLAGTSRGIERHRTLKHTTKWSYDLLDDDERLALDRSSVFVGGFDLRAAEAVVFDGDVDDYKMLDVLDSLVRKSLLTVNSSTNITRFAMLESVREFGIAQLAIREGEAACRLRHASLFSDRSVAAFADFGGTEDPRALQWYGAESANLRSAFAWSVEAGEWDLAATIAAMTSSIAVSSYSFEPTAWCEQLLAIPQIDGHRLLKFLYAGASLCVFSGRPFEALRYCQLGRAIPPDSGCEPVPPVPEALGLIMSHMFTGRAEEFVALARESVGDPQDRTSVWRACLVWSLGVIGQYDEAAELAGRMLGLVRASGNRSMTSFALTAYAKAHERDDPQGAVDAYVEAVAIARDIGNRLYDLAFSRELAGLQAVHGDPASALESFRYLIDEFDKTGDTGNLAATLGYLVVLFDRIGEASAAATTFGAVTGGAAALTVTTGLAETANRLRQFLGDEPFAKRVTEGSAMTGADARRYASEQINRIQADLAGELAAKNRPVTQM